MEIHVTRDDIEHGFQCECLNCPVTLALNRETGRRWEVSPIVGVSGEYFAMEQSGGCNEPIMLPDHVCAFISDFDSNDPIGPFVFEFLWEAKP